MRELISGLRGLIIGLSGLILGLRRLISGLKGLEGWFGFGLGGGDGWTDVHIEIHSCVL